MNDLIARLEAATEGSHALDAEIAYRIAEMTPGIMMHEDSIPGAEVFAFWQDGICHNCSRWEPFTTSLDAALTLVPAEHAIRLQYEVGGLGDGFHAAVFPHGEPARWPGIQMQRANSPALALCIAALKARSNSDSHHGRRASESAGQENG